VDPRWPAGHAESLLHIDLLTILSLLYLAFIATIVGYGIWGALLGRYETWRGAAVAAGAGGRDGQRGLLLGETLKRLQLLGAVLIMAGLYINVFGLRIVRPGMARVKKPRSRG
jgi:O-acetylserine/cysteine efflux transporter